MNNIEIFRKLQIVSRDGGTIDTLAAATGLAVPKLRGILAQLRKAWEAAGRNGDDFPLLERKQRVDGGAVRGPRKATAQLLSFFETLE